MKERRRERNDRGDGVHRLFLSCDERGKIGAASVEEEGELIRERKGQPRESKLGGRRDFEWCIPRAFVVFLFFLTTLSIGIFFVKVLYFCNNGLMFP